MGVVSPVRHAVGNEQGNEEIASFNESLLLVQQVILTIFACKII